MKNKKITITQKELTTISRFIDNAVCYIDHLCALVDWDYIDAENTKIDKKKFRQYHKAFEAIFHLESKLKSAISNH